MNTGSNAPTVLGLGSKGAYRMRTGHIGTHEELLSIEELDARLAKEEALFTLLSYL